VVILLHRTATVLLLAAAVAYYSTYNGRLYWDILPRGMVVSAMEPFTLKVTLGDAHSG